jgi:hypothetical protein
MYQLNIRAQAGKLAALIAHRPITHVQHQAPAASHKPTSYLRAMLSALANLAALRVIPGSSLDTPARIDPRDPRNW